MSTKGVVTVNGDAMVNVSGNGRGDFLEEVVPMEHLDKYRAHMDGSGEASKPRSQQHSIGDTRKPGARVSGTIYGIDAERVSNELDERSAL